MAITAPLHPGKDSPPRTGRWVLIAAVLASGMTLIDEMALNLALPAIQAGLGASGAGLLWVANAYALCLAALLLAGGALGDRHGRKRVLMAGIAIFSAASLVCGLAPGIAFLIAARAVQGVGAALMVPGGLALITALFRPDEHGRAIGIWSAWCVVVATLGPVLGGLLAHAGLWRGIFFINLPVGILALMVLARGVPESRRADAPAGIDYPGAVAAVVGLACLNFGLIEAPGRGLGDALVLVALGAGVAALVLFVIIEARSSHPLLPLELFRSRRFVGASLLTLCLFTAFRGMLLFLPLNLIQVQGYDASLAGLAQLPVLLCMVMFSGTTGRVADRLGPRLLLLAGPLLVGAGFCLFALPGITGGPADFWVAYLPALCLLGVGFTMTVIPLNAVSMAALPTDRSGLASGVSGTISRLSGVLAVVLMGAVALAAFVRLLDARAASLGLPHQAALELHAAAADLGATRVPEGLEPGQVDAVGGAIKLAFIDTFRLVCAIAAGLSWLGALAAAFLVGGSAPPPDDKRLLPGRDYADTNGGLPAADAQFPRKNESLRS